MALAYTAPTWSDGSGVGISASQLQALCDCMEGLVQGSDKAITNIAISGQTITLTFADGSVETGTASGLKGISSIAKTGTSGNVDTYTITYTDGSTSTFTVTNGADGSFYTVTAGIKSTDDPYGNIEHYISGDFYKNGVLYNQSAYFKVTLVNESDYPPAPYLVDGSSGTFTNGHYSTGSIGGIPSGATITTQIFTDSTMTTLLGMVKVIIGAKGDQGEQGIQGPAGADGADGQDGADGVSPEVTITTITGGHRVNITDADHPTGQNFDVMDGANSVIPNPQGTAVGPLESIGINGDKYYIQGGGGTTIVQIPSVVGDSFTYNGISQGPTITGLDATHCTVTGATAINAGSYTLTIALNDPSSMVWSDSTTADKTYSYTIAKAPQTLTASKNNVSLTVQQPSDTVTISGQQTSLNVSSSASGVATVSESSGVVTITAVGNGSATVSVYAEETANYTQSATISISVAVALAPDGKTVTPTDDIQTWLNCANIWDKTYTTINEVLADSTTLLALISSNNAADYMKRSTTWASAVTADSTAMSLIGANDYCADTLLADSTWLTAICNSTYFESVLNVKVPTLNSGSTGVSGGYTDTGYAPYMAFDGDANTRWYGYVANGTSELWLKYDFGIAVNIYKAHIYTTNVTNSISGPINIKFQGSNDDTNWIDLTTLDSIQTEPHQVVEKDYVWAGGSYRYYRYVTWFDIRSDARCGEAWTLQFYGRASA